MNIVKNAPIFRLSVLSVALMSGAAQAAEEQVMRLKTVDVKAQLITSTHRVTTKSMGVDIDGYEGCVI